MNTSLRYSGRTCRGVHSMRGAISGVALVIGLTVVLGALFAAGLWPRWHALKTAQAEASRDQLPAALYVTALRPATVTVVAVAVIRSFELLALTSS